MSETEVIDVDAMLESLSGPMETWVPGQLTYYGPDTRALLLSGAIDEEITAAFCSQLKSLNTIDPEEPITVYLNTEGGSVVHALTTYDVMKTLSNPIVMIVEGACMSAGLVILSGADYRLATPNSMLFYHQVIAVSAQISSQQDMDSSNSFYEWCNERVQTVIRSRAKMSKTKFAKELGTSTSRYITATEAKELKLIDEIIPHKKKKAKIKVSV